MIGLPTTVSLFCGAGGESLGKHAALASLGIKDEGLLSYAVNHWDLAVNAHRRNLPMVLVEKGDITKVNASTYGIAAIALLWASPSCVHHSRARGGRPKSDQQRAHAWEVTDRWLKVANVTVMLVENVPEFKDWGPLHETHNSGCRAGSYGRFLGLSGRLAGMFPLAKCRKGCHFNSPIKDRRGEFFAEWVADLRAQGYEVDHRVINCADLGAPTTRKRFFLQAVKDGKGIHWPEASHRDPKKGVDMFTGHLPTWRTAAECIDWSIPCPSIFDRKKPLAEATLKRIAAGIDKFVINSQCPFLVNVTHGGRLEGLDEPFKTITGANRGEKALIVPTIVGVGGRAGQSRPRGADEPMGASTTKADAALVAASMISLRGTSPEQIQATCGSVESPVPTISAGGGHAALCAAFMTKFQENSIGHGLEEPLHTVMAGAPRFGMIAATLMTNTSGHACTDPDQTVPAVTTGNQQAVIAANLIGIDNQSGSGVWDAEAPLTTSTTKARHAAVAAFLIKYHATGGQWQGADVPLHAVTTKDEFGLVTVEINGETYVIVDIGMRMLEPKELAAAMGFPADYLWLKEDGTPLSKKDQVKMIGNAVPPPVAQALVEAVVRTRPELFGLAEAIA